MARRLVQTRAAERDVAEQVDYLAAERPSAARRYLVAYGAAFERLLAMPKLGVVRSFPVRGYEAVRLASTGIPTVHHRLSGDQDNGGGDPRPAFSEGSDTSPAAVKAGCMSVDDDLNDEPTRSDD